MDAHGNKAQLMSIFVHPSAHGGEVFLCCLADNGTRGSVEDFPECRNVKLVKPTETLISP
jgi:hypothetical protein